MIFRRRRESAGKKRRKKCGFCWKKWYPREAETKAYIEGYEIGGKTATSQTLPRSAHKYISSFLGFAPADDPKVLVLVIIRNPSGIYYGGTIAAPVAKEIFENILPYLEWSSKYLIIVIILQRWRLIVMKLEGKKVLVVGAGKSGIARQNCYGLKN